MRNDDRIISLAAGFVHLLDELGMHIEVNEYGEIERFVGVSSEPGYEGKSLEVSFPYFSKLCDKMLKLEKVKTEIATFPAKTDNLPA